MNNMIINLMNSLLKAFKNHKKEVFEFVDNKIRECSDLILF